MALPMHSNPVQDVAPKGGFKPFMYQRNVRNRGPGVAGLFGARCLLCAMDSTRWDREMLSEECSKRKRDRRESI